MKEIKESLEGFDKAELLNMIDYLQTNLHRRNDQLRRARTTISVLKDRLSRMKSTVENQRKRIIELHA